MKLLLSILGGLFLVLVVVAVGFYGYMAYEGRGLEASSKAYIEESIPAIVSSWSKDELLKRSSPQLQKIVSDKPEQLDQIFRKLSELGHLKSMDEIKGHPNISYTTQEGKVTTADYVVSATFDNGEGSITTRLVQFPDGQWQFLALHVSSPRFLR